MSVLREVGILFDVRGQIELVSAETREHDFLLGFSTGVGLRRDVQVVIAVRLVTVLDDFVDRVPFPLLGQVHAPRVFGAVLLVLDQHHMNDDVFDGFTELGFDVDLASIWIVFQVDEETSGGRVPGVGLSRRRRVVEFDRLDLHDREASPITIA